METALGLLLESLIAVGGGVLSGNEAAAVEPEESYCVKCHGERERLEVERLFVSEKHLADDIHWQKGLACHDCHGGDPSAVEANRAHTTEAGYRRIESPVDIPGFCGHCHSNIEYMRRFRPAYRTHQMAAYWSSGHGRRLKEDNDPKVATCVSCHGHHGIRRVNDQQSPVYWRRLAETCAVCHSDPKVTEGREYQGRPLGHNQFELWMRSVHAEQLLEKGNRAGPTCNDCHGDHSAVSPEVDAVTNACGECHTKVARLFARARMKHQFDEVGLPGCATCHGCHDIRSPTDELLGMGSGATCFHCHADGKFGAPLAGAQAAVAMRNGLEQLKARIAEAERKISQAARLGMGVNEPRFHLHRAFTSLTNARSLIHGFELDPMRQSLDEGLRAADQVILEAENILREHTHRRIWLGGSVIPVLVVILLLLRYIRTLPNPTISNHPAAQP